MGFAAEEAYRARSTGKDTLVLSPGTKKWAVGDYLCFTYPTGSIECGQVTGIGKSGTRVKLDEPKKGGTGDTAYVYVEKKERGLASVTSTAYQSRPLVALDPELSYFQLAARDKANSTDATISSSLTFGAALTLSPWHRRRFQPFVAVKATKIGFAASPGTTFTNASPLLFSGVLGFGYHPIENDDRLHVALSGGLAQEFYVEATKVGELDVRTVSSPTAGLTASYDLVASGTSRLSISGGFSAILSGKTATTTTSTAFGYFGRFSGTWDTGAFRLQPALYVSRLQSASTAVEQSRTQFGLLLGVGWSPSP